MGNIFLTYTVNIGTNKNHFNTSTYLGIVAVHVSRFMTMVHPSSGDHLIINNKYRKIGAWNTEISFLC